MPDMTLIVPSCAETALTGFIGAGERTIRNKVLRVEWHNGQPARFLIDGAPADPEAWRTNRSLAKLMLDSHRVFCAPLKA